MADCLPTKETTEQVAEEHFVIDRLNSFLRIQKNRTRKIFIRRYWYMDSIIDKHHNTDHHNEENSQSESTVETQSCHHSNHH